jgi:hypothetical protein
VYNTHQFVSLKDGCQLPASTIKHACLAKYQLLSATVCMLFRVHEPDCYASFWMCGMLAVCKALCLSAVCVHPAWHDACMRLHFLSLQQWDNSMDDYVD